MGGDEREAGQQQRAFEARDPRPEVGRGHAPTLPPRDGAGRPYDPVSAGGLVRLRRVREAARRRPYASECDVDGRWPPSETGVGVQGAQPHLAPRHALLDERGRAHHDGGGDLDRLQDDPVAERLGGADAVAARQHRDAGGLEDAEVRRRQRQHGGDVDGEQDRRGRAEPRPVVVEPERLEQHDAGEPLQRPGGELRGGGDEPEARAAEDGEPRAHARQRGAGGEQPARHPLRARGAAGAQQRGRDEHGARAPRTARSRRAAAPAGGPANSPTVLNITAPRIASASRLSSVCETSVPSTEGSSSRGRPSRRATISAREGSPSRAGSVADISTPIDVPWSASVKRGRDGRQRGAQDRVPRDRPQHHRGAHQRDREQHPGGARGEHGRGDGVPADALDREPGAAGGGERRRRRARPGGPPCAARARRLTRGSSDGSRRAGRRGPPAAERSPMRTAARAAALAGSGIAMRVVVGLEHLLGDARPRVLLGRAAGALAEALEPRRVEREVVQRLGQRERVARRHQQPVAAVLDDAAVARDVRRHHRRPGRERLGQHHAERLAAERGRAEHVRAGERGALLVVVDAAERGARRAGRPAAGPAPPPRPRSPTARAGCCSRSASKARSSTGSPLRSTAWPTNAISSGSPGARRRGAGAPPAGSVTPLGTIRYSPPKKRRPVHSAASDTAIRTRRRFMLRLAPHSHATACGSRWCE